MPSPTDRIKIIQVGAGAMGRLWLDVLAGSADVELVGLVDIDLSAAQLSAAGAGLPNVALARSLPELLDLVAADAVLNVTVPEAHAEVSITALLHGLAVLCEKPLADTLAAALSMIAAAEVGGRLLMVSQSRRYWRNLDALRGQIAQLGRLGLVQCSFFKAPHFGGFREEMAYPLLTDMAIHQFDLARRPDRQRTRGRLLRVLQPERELVRRRRGRQRCCRLRGRHSVRVYRQLVQSWFGNVLEWQLANQRGRRHSAVGR